MTSSSPLLVALIILSLSFLVLLLLTAIYLFHQWVIVRRFRNDFLALHERRSARVRGVLADGMAQNGGEAAPVGAKPVYSFSGWIDLGKNGSVTVAGQVFQPTEVFKAVARDGNNIPRAQVSGNGQAEVVITSHGQTFRAHFTGADWEVQETEGTSS